MSWGLPKKLKNLGGTYCAPMTLNKCREVFASLVQAFRDFAAPNRPFLPHRHPLGHKFRPERLHPLARARPVDCCPEQLEVMVVEHEVPPPFANIVRLLQNFAWHYECLKQLPVTLQDLDSRHCPTPNQAPHDWLMQLPASASSRPALPALGVVCHDVAIDELAQPRPPDLS